MCKLNRWGDTRIDPCMRKFIENLNILMLPTYKVIACCCGHKKYPMTVVIIDKSFKAPFELFSNKNLHHKKKFYKRDKQGYYYIPETI
jgi:hypothetical protein